MKTKNDLIVRQQLILLRIYDNNDRLITSQEIADFAGVSSRTVKSDIAQIAAVLGDNGAKLIGKANRGYYIEVSNKEKHSVFLQSLRAQSALFSLVSANEDVRYIELARRLIASDKPISLHSLETEMYFSKALLQKLLLRTKEFFTGFRLHQVHEKQGIKVYGTEKMLRLAMCELVEVGDSIQNYRLTFSQWTDCPLAERQNIRRRFLQVLRESGLHIRDSAAQKIAIYLVIAGKRMLSNYYTRLTNEEIKFCQKMKTWGVAGKIYSEIGFGEVPPSEWALLSVLLMINLDLDFNDSTPDLFKEKGKEYADLVILEMKKYGIELNKFRKALAAEIVPVIATSFFKLDGVQRNDFTYNTGVTSIPLCLCFAELMSNKLAEVMGCEMTKMEVWRFCNFFLSILISNQYPIHKLRLLTTHSLSRRNAQVQAEALQRMFPQLIESITPVALYEVRGLDTSMYDAVITENVFPGKDTGLFGYNYHYPAAHIPFTLYKNDYRTIYNQVLVDAYDIEKVLPIFNKIIIQTLSWKSLSEIQSLFDENVLPIINSNKTKNSVSVYTVPCNNRYSSCEFFINTNKHIDKNNGKMIIICRFRTREKILKLKAFETFLQAIQQDTMLMDRFIKDPNTTIQSIVKSSLFL